MPSYLVCTSGAIQTRLVSVLALVAIADGSNEAISGLSLEIIGGIEPTPRLRRREIARFVSHAVENVRSHELRIVLVQLLGKFRDAYSLMVLEKTFGKHQDTKLRLSVIESLTNFGALAGGPPSQY